MNDDTVDDAATPSEFSRRDFLTIGPAAVLSVAATRVAIAQTQQERAARDDTKLLDLGPFLGACAPGELRLWMRHPTGTQLRLRVNGPETEQARDYSLVAACDGCASAVFDSLPAAASRTEAYVTWISDDRRNERQPRLPFAIPRACYPTDKLRLALGSCANEKTGQANPAWNAIFRSDADALLLLGDTPYIDTTDLEVQRRRYREFYANAELANLMQLTPTWATWDDHDFAGDGADGTAKGKEDSRRAFLEYHALASYGEKDQGIYTRFQLGAADVFVLDTRWFSGTEPSFADATKKTLLGKQQWEWLTRGLKESTAPFKLLACGMVWNGAVRPGKPDYWMAYPHERAALFEFLAREKIAGVVLIGGDIHRSRIHAFPPEDTGVSYPLHELVTSPLGDHPMAAANVPSPDLLFDCGEKHQFLLLDIEASRLTARFHTAEKGEVRTMELQADDLFPHSAIASTPRNQDGSQPRTQLVMERAKLAQADILFLGDSITEGWEGEGASIWREKLLPLGAVNLGVGGERTENLIWRLDHGQVDGFAKNEKPPRVGVLLIGTNNFGYGAPSNPEEVVQGLRAIVARLQRKLPAMKILLVSIFPRSDGANVPPVSIARTNEVLAKLADGERVTFLDLSRTFLGADGTIDPKLSPDRLHLNAAGYERWFAALQPEIARLLAR